MRRRNTDAQNLCPNTDETSRTLRDSAMKLIEAAGMLAAVAETMDRMGVGFLNLRCGCANRAITEKLCPLPRRPKKTAGNVANAGGARGKGIL